MLENCHRAGRAAARALAAWMLTAGLLAGCDALPFGYTPLKEIVAAPAHFEGKEVKVRGAVTDVTKIPLFDIQNYVLEEEGTEITVVTRNQLPAKGEKVSAKGRVTSVAIVSGQSLGLRIEETERLSN